MEHEGTLSSWSQSKIFSNLNRESAGSKIINLSNVFLIFCSSPSRGRHGARSAWGGEIGGAGVDNYGSPGTSVSNALMPRLHSSDSGEGPSLDKVK